MTISIRYAETDQDCIDLHQFLCVVAQPVLLAEIDAVDSIAEVMRVRDEGVALIAEKNGHLVGTLGLINVKWWYSKAKFLTNRFFFVFPQFHHTGAAAMLLAEASAIAANAELKLVIISNAKRRKTAAGTSLYFISEHEVLPDLPSTLQ